MSERKAYNLKIDISYLAEDDADAARIANTLQRNVSFANLGIRIQTIGFFDIRNRYPQGHFDRVKEPE